MCATLGLPYTWIAVESPGRSKLWSQSAGCTTHSAAKHKQGEVLGFAC